MGNQNLTEAIHRITDLMLKIERQAAEKDSMIENLKLKEKKWIQNDTIYKQRRIILNYIVKINLSMGYDLYTLQSLTSL